MNGKRDADESTPRVEMKSIGKRFGGVQALRDVDLTLRAGEIQGLIGENGAGKSTLIKILAGAYGRDSGTILVDGEEVAGATPRGMLDRGVSVIYQEFMLAPELTVAENMFVENLQGSGPFIRWGALRERASAQLEAIGFGHIHPNTRVGDLTVAEQQIVEISKALVRRSKVLVFDEPTAVLTMTETAALLHLIRQLRDDGTAVLYVSHRLDELFTICDTITVLKDGGFVDEVRTADVTEARLVQMMVGRELDQLFPVRSHARGDEVLRVRNLSCGTRVKDASFVAHAGEVVGFAGLVGSGRTELMRAIFGADRYDGGEVLFEGRRIQFSHPKEAVACGIGLVPEDRKGQGLILEQSIMWNAGLVSQNKLGFIRPGAERRLATEMLARLNTKYGQLGDPVSSLSGGNQQKVSLAKWLDGPLKLVILDEPTRGVDVGAKTEIYKIIDGLAQQGYAVLVVSSEMMEIIGLCDRVYVMREGVVKGELSGADLTEERVAELAMGTGGGEL